MDIHAIETMSRCEKKAISMTLHMEKAIHLNKRYLHSQIQMLFLIFITLYILALSPEL